MDMLNKIIIYTGLFAMTCLASCSLDPELTKSYSDEVPWTNEKNLELYLNKFYPLIGQTYYTPYVEDDAHSDILKMNTPVADANLFIFGSQMVTPDNNAMGCWDWAYTWTRDCNEFLDGLKKYGSNLPEEVTLRAEAEIRFFRAWVSFKLSRVYGGSFIIFEQLPDKKENSRSSVEECWDFIERDIDFAIEHLPVKVVSDKENNQGKLTKGAALAFKARYMLYAERWKKASDAAKAVMDLGIYELEDDYAKLFTYKRAAGTSKESILDFGYQSPNFGYSFDYFYCPPGDKGYAQVSPTEELVSAYQMADGSDFSWDNPEQAKNPYEGREKRFYASILYNGADWKGRKIETYVGGVDGYAIGGGTTCTGYYMRKLFDEGQRNGFQPGELTYYAMRYAEVLLIYAEAMAQQDNLSEALIALNQVRLRAGFDKPVTASSKSEFMSLLRHERMIELAFEGHRYWDLRRWKQASIVLNNVNCHGTKITRNEDGTFTYDQVDCDGGKKRIFPEKYYRFPIPLTEIQRNPACEQSDEWK